MFSENEKKAWRDVAAPQSLRERVLEGDFAASKSRFTVSPVLVRRIGALAACFVLMLVLTVAYILPLSGDITVSFDGQELGQSSVTVPMNTESGISVARFGNNTRQGFEFSLDVSAKTSVKAQGGELYIIDGQSVLLCTEGEYTFEKKADFYYIADIADGNETQIALNSGKTEKTIHIAYDELTNSWSVRCIAEN